MARIGPPLACAIASALGVGFSARVGPASPFVITLAAILPLLPGLSVTTAMNELATRNLASGSARFAGAVTQLLGQGFGLAIGASLASKILGAAITPPPTRWPPSVLAGGVFAAAIAFTVLTRSRPRDTGLVIFAAALAFSSARVGTALLGAQLGTFLGSSALAIASNLYARLRDRPVSTMLVPGMLLLVPGSLGLRGVSSLLDHDVIAGVSGAFEMVMVSIGLVAGLLVANVVVPSRRYL
jgi:uncharacterized membrane protein YjjB (DUF3815 family)